MVRNAKRVPGKTPKSAVDTAAALVVTTHPPVSVNLTGAGLPAILAVRVTLGLNAKSVMTALHMAAVMDLARLGGQVNVSVKRDGTALTALAVRNQTSCTSTRETAAWPVLKMMACRAISREVVRLTLNRTEHRQYVNA